MGDGATLAEDLRRSGVARGTFVALTYAPHVGAAIATPTSTLPVAVAGAADVAALTQVDDELRPRWVLWSGATALALVAAGARLATCWDIAAVHRLLCGGWRADPARAWAHVHDLSPDTIPTDAPPDLFNQIEHDAGDADDPIRPDGHLRPDWVNGGWASTPDRLLRWAELASRVAARQQARIAPPDDPSRAASAARALLAARAESTAELLCAELTFDGLPMDRAIAEEIISGFCGPRPRTEAEAADHRARRDRDVLRHGPAGDIDLRSPGQVKALLRRIGVDVPDTRAWRLEALRDSHPLIGPLLAWRKAERIATTYGYAWLDEWLGDDGRLRGEWSACDGAAGRMTASAGLHNMTADLRAAVVAEAGHVLVRADLGQIEPRVLAAVSQDRALARATVADDMYSPVAEQLSVDRATAKVAVLGAMYGQTTGHGAHALQGLKAAYPVAMAYLEDADRAGQRGRDLRTYGGRLIPLGSADTGTDALSERDVRSRAAARGRYGRNALVQGAAAELFKVWAVTVRARAAPLGAQIVLCLHDELLVHAPVAHGETVARLLDDCLQEAAARWTPDGSVRFVADISVITRWSDAKD